MRTNPHDGTEPLAVEARLRSLAERARVIRRVREGGYSIHGDDKSLFGGECATVVAALQLTPSDREVIPILLRHDHTAQMAQEVGPGGEAVGDRLRRLERRLGVGSRHRTVVRLLEYGLLRIAPGAAGRLPGEPGSPDASYGSREEPDFPRIAIASTVFRVYARLTGQRSRLAQWLRDGGDPVMEDDRLPFTLRLADPGAGSPLSARRREVVRVFLDRDHAEGMAGALRIRVKTVYDHLHGLMEELEVGSWHRLVVRLVEVGWLTVEGTP